MVGFWAVEKGMVCACVVVGLGAVEGGAGLLSMRVGWRCGLEGVLGGVLWVQWGWCGWGVRAIFAGLVVMFVSQV